MNQRVFWRGFWGLFLLAIGILWILNNFEVIDFNFGDALALFFPLLLIAIGLLLLFRPRFRSGGPGNVRSISRVFGDVKLSGEDLDPNGLEISTVFGEVKLDLTKARFTEGENELFTQTIFGDVELKLPEGVAVSASGGSFIGDISILGKKEHGFGNELSAADPNFESQPKRLRAHASTALGDIEISR